MSKRNKKFKFHKRFIWIPIIAVVGIGLVLGFPLIQAIGEVNPTFPDFEIPFEDPEDIMNEIKDVKDEIEDIIEQPVVICSADSTEIELFAQCELKTRGEVVVIVPPTGVDPETFEPCSGINPTTVLDCSIAVDQKITELLASLEPEPEPSLPPETSIDPPEVQLCDIEPDNPLCGTIFPEPNSVSLIADIVKVSSANERFEVTETFDLILASIFVEETTDIDFRNGFIEIELFIQSEPQVELTGTGEFDIVIGQTSIFSLPIDLLIDGTTDIDGRIPIQIVGTTGIPSNEFRLDISKQFNKFTNEQITNININVKQLDVQQIQEIVCITTPCNPIISDFTISDVTVFSIGILRDDILILIVDEEGITQRVFPSDSRIVVLTKTSKSEEYFTGRIQRTVFDSTFYGNGQGCSQLFIVSSTSNTAQKSSFATVPAPTISGVTIMDTGNNILASASGGSGIVLDFDELKRNENYLLTIVSPSVSGDLVYGQAQETKTASCVQQATVTTTVTRSTTGNCSVACGSCTQTTYQVFGSLNLGKIQCDIPTG